jgi:predicted peptidase
MATKKQSEKSDILPEYDFKSGARGKRHKAYSRGHNVKINNEDGAVMLAPDVREYFHDSDSVNDALRALIKLLPKKRKSA